MIKQYRYVMTFMNIFAHANILRSKLRGINPKRDLKNFTTEPNLQEISSDYILPDEQTHIEAHRVLDNTLYNKTNWFRYIHTSFSNRLIVMCAHNNSDRQNYLNFLRQKVKELKKFNPSLETIYTNPDSAEHQYDFIMGAISGYNPDDIDHYLNAPPDIKNEAQQKQHTLIREYDLKDGINFIMSLETIDKVRDQLFLQYENVRSNRHDIC